jgi:hypothetical protein
MAAQKKTIQASTQEFQVHTVSSKKQFVITAMIKLPNNRLVAHQVQKAQALSPQTITLSPRQLYRQAVVPSKVPLQ